MNTTGWIQLLLYVAILLAITKPLGLYLFKVLDAQGKTFLDPVLRPVERLIYRLYRRRSRSRSRTGSNIPLPCRCSALLRHGIHVWCASAADAPAVASVRDRHAEPAAQQDADDRDLAFNTAASFTTNTNWQNYGGENAMSYFSQMVALASHNFWSAATGIAIAAALVRGIARDKSKTIGNFWVDLVRLNCIC